MPCGSTFLRTALRQLREPGDALLHEPRLALEDREPAARARRELEPFGEDRLQSSLRRQDLRGLADLDVQLEASEDASGILAHMHNVDRVLLAGLRSGGKRDRDEAGQVVADRKSVV